MELTNYYSRYYPTHFVTCFSLSLKRLRDKFHYPVPAEAKLGPAQLNPQLFGFIIFKMEEGEYLAVWHSLAQLIICMTLSQNNEAGKILYKR